MSRRGNKRKRSWSRNFTKIIKWRRGLTHNDINRSRSGSPCKGRKLRGLKLGSMKNGTKLCKWLKRHRKALIKSRWKLGQTLDHTHKHHLGLMDRANRQNRFWLMKHRGRIGTNHYKNSSRNQVLACRLIAARESSTANSYSCNEESSKNHVKINYKITQWQRSQCQTINCQEPTSSSRWPARKIASCRVSIRG